MKKWRTLLKIYIQVNVQYMFCYHLEEGQVLKQRHVVQGGAGVAQHAVHLYLAALNGLLQHGDRVARDADEARLASLHYLGQRGQRLVHHDVQVRGELEVVGLPQRNLS